MFLRKKLLMKTKPHLYKRTTKGNIQIWYAEIDGGSYHTISGQIDGKKTISSWTRCKSKNVGKTNETSPEDQAELEVMAMYEKQIKKGYFENINDVDNRQGVEPMLATKWKDRLRFLIEAGVTSVSVQPKLDGARCIVTKDGCFSRNKELFVSVPHISDALAPLFEQFPDLILDGELYNHEYSRNFNKIMSLIKKKTPTAEDLIESAAKVQYWIYDVPSIDVGFIQRYSTYEAIVYVINHPSIVAVDTILDCPLENVGNVCSEYLQSEFEGGMVRLNEKYEFKRSTSLMKWKEFQDDEFLIVDVVDGDGNREGVAANVICQTKEGKLFGSGPLGSLEYCRQLLVDKSQIIGKMGTVVFQDYTPDGIPRFGKFKGVRDYE